MIIVWIVPNLYFWTYSSLLSVTCVLLENPQVFPCYFIIHEILELVLLILKLLELNMFGCSRQIKIVNCSDHLLAVYYADFFHVVRLTS